MIGLREETMHVLALPYRTAVIGRTGRGDYGHGLDLAVLNQPKLKVVAVADEDPAGRAPAAKRLGVEKTYDDYRAMLEREKPQFVVVAPRWLDGHKDMILACAEHGVLGIFCEKPLAPDLASCDAIVDGVRAVARQARDGLPDPVQPAVRAGQGADRRGGDRRGPRAPRAGQGGPSGRRRGPDGPGRPHPGPLPRPARRAGVVLRPRVGTGSSRRTRDSSVPGAEGIGPLAGDRVDAMFGFQGTPVVAHFATSRPKEPGRRFGLTICGSKGCIWMGTGWTPPPSSCEIPPGRPRARRAWSPIVGAGEGQGGRAVATTWPPETEPSWPT